MFVVYLGSVVTTLLAVVNHNGAGLFTAAISLWLWFTVLFANFAEALAEGRSKAQAESLREIKNQLGEKVVSGGAGCSAAKSLC